MKTEKFNTRFMVLAGIILFAAFSRVIPHLPNFTPLISIALFGGTYFTNKKNPDSTLKIQKSAIFGNKISLLIFEEK